MTTLLMAAAAAMVAHAIYIAALSARANRRPGDFLHAGFTVPTWATIFAGTGAVVAGLGLPDHLFLLSTYGLQYSHVAVGLILVALCGALIQKRLWLASRIAGLATVGELAGAYYGSTALRIALLAVAFLFSVPLAAYTLAELGAIAAAATGGALSASVAIWVAGFFLFLASAIGGWRAVVYLVGGQSFLVLTLLLFIGAFAAATFDSLAFVAAGIPTAEPVLGDQIPGVAQFTDGVGKEIPPGGIWTTTAILSFALAMLGLVLSPSYGFLAITSATRRGFAFEQVWMTGGLAAGALLLVGPVLAAEIAAGAGGSGPPALAAFAARLGALNQLVAVSFLIMLIASLQIAVAFFVGSGASIAAIEIIKRYVLPDLASSGLRLTARIALAALYLSVALAATFAPLSAAIFGSLALSLSAQLLPALLGLCWLPWVSRSAVLTGLIVGTLLVVFTEPLGLITFSGLFIDLPWGRWPLTIHSAGWGLVFNAAACLLVSLFTRGGEERERRDRLHDEFRRGRGAAARSGAVRTAQWSLTLIWTFLALGPGTILGNTFFSRPVFAGGDVPLGVPSLLVWQILFWFLGVLIVGWLAYGGRVSAAETEPRRTLLLTEPGNPLLQSSRPAWISRSLGRLAERDAPGGQRRR